MVTYDVLQGLKTVRIECTESVVINNIIHSFIKKQPTIEKLVYILRIFN